ncbi:MAG: hypothetical protein MK105_15870 [Crocinitomicaceae bacterium]|nr:hypothetical protein [Crocinitomicaceae bacterium]
MEIIDNEDIETSGKTEKRRVSRVHFIMGLLSLIFNAFIFLAMSVAFVFIFINSTDVVYFYPTSFYVQNLFVLASLVMGIIAAILIMRGKRYGTTLYGITNVLWLGLQMRFMLEENDPYRVIFIIPPIIFMFVIFKSKRFRESKVISD